MFDFCAPQLGSVTDGKRDIWVRSASTDLGGLKTSCIEAGYREHANSSVCANRSGFARSNSVKDNTPIGTPESIASKSD